MPGVKRARDNEREDHDTENEEEQDSDSDRSSLDESISSDGTESDDSSELDEEECDRRRGEYLTDLTDLERQFSLLREQLYRERVTQVEAKLEEVRLGEAAEYLIPVEELQEGRRVRLEVAHVLRQFRLQNITNKYEAEKSASQQNFENEKVMLWDSIESELEDKIRRLEEDRNNVDVTSQVWAEQNLHRKRRRHRQQGSNSSTDRKRKKPTTVAGPYIVYMLREPDIVDDWTMIKKALTASKRKTKFGKITSPRHYAEGLSL
ncbi:breast cancer metastasis-suppressor 1-like protein isoform X3 [Portunus trituberculatus]|uniref:breast cancer metastasis-suppressor 1-like protein isoform X3 n=1 Tax=Portunus trituberculatus TaxID=210409 RepID=UPI001E1CEE2E|nr:breast cancer metastasis-suppressor 1-like protein isoform X3 [Portunus trituberculatus]